MRKRFSIALIERDGNELLFLRRAPDREFAPDLWGFPAGHIEAGENPRQCIERELREEIGDGARLRALARTDAVPDRLFGGTMEVHLFHYRWLGGTVSLNAEHTQWRWADAAVYRELATAPGVEEDIAHLGIWPLAELRDPARLADFEPAPRLPP